MPLAILPAQAKLVLSLCKGLRNYHLKVLQSLEAGDPTYHAVQSLWDDAGDFSEPESEGGGGGVACKREKETRGNKIIKTQR